MPQQKADDPPTPGLTRRQRRAVPLIVGSPTYTQGCGVAGIDRKTFYRWLKDPAFRAELDRQQKAIFDEALGLLRQNTSRAIETLTGLIDDPDRRLARLAAKDVLDYYTKHVELATIEERLAKVEERLASRG